MPRLMSDLVPALLASRDGVLKSLDLRWYPEPALTVVMAARAIPGSYAKGSVIEGLDEAAAVEGVEIFHAGTKAEGGRIARQWRTRAQRLGARQDRTRGARRERTKPFPAFAGRRVSAGTTSAGARWSAKNKEDQQAGAGLISDIARKREIGGNMSASDRQSTFSGTKEVAERLRFDVGRLEVLSARRM